MSAVLVCDIGGTSFRGALIDAEGTVLAQHAIPGPLLDEPGGRSDEGRSEIDPGAWWDALMATAAALANAAPAAFGRVEAIAICGVTRTQVLLDRDGRSVRPAITWRDARAAPGVAALVAALPDHPERAQVNAFHPLARLAWLRDAEPAAMRRVATVLDPKDDLNLRLTGRAVSDPVSMARLAAAAAPGPDGRSLLEAAGLDPALVPELIEPTDRVGAVRAGFPAPLDALAGRPVVCAANDTWAAVTGLGAMRPGLAYNISGTTEVFGAVLDRRVEAEGLLSVDWRGVHQLGGPGQNGADTVTWLLACLDPDRPASAVGPALDALLALPRDPQPLLFLPYLQGERAPYWDPSLRGAFVGLNRRHRGADLAWAVLEGVAFLNRTMLGRAEAALGRPVAEIRFGGGAARNRAWCQVKADVCERPVVVCASPEPGLLGAAIVAWTGLGRFASLTEAQDRLVRVAHRYAPRSERVDAYRQLAALYARTEAALAPISRELVHLAAAATALPGLRPSGPALSPGSTA